jgi:hypothetical protein
MNLGRLARAPPPLFRQSGEEPVYAPVPSYDALRKVLDDKLAEYNETNTVGWPGGVT